MWFDELMDDSKAALQIVNKNKGLFVPVFIKLALNIGIFIAAMIPIIITIAHLNVSDWDYLPFEEIVRQVAPLLGIIPLALLGLFIGSCLLEAGTVNLYKSAAEGTKLCSKVFFQGIKKYFFKILGGMLFLGIILAVLSPILLLLFLIYVLTVGILTAQWGILFLMAAVLLFFSPWVNIMAASDLGPLKSLKMGFRLGKRHFKGLFLAALANILVSSYLIALGGGVAAILAAWLITGVVYTYYRMIVYLVYVRNREELL